MPGVKRGFESRRFEESRAGHEHAERQRGGRENDDLAVATRQVPRDVRRPRVRRHALQEVGPSCGLASGYRLALRLLRHGGDQHSTRCRDRRAAFAERMNRARALCSCVLTVALGCFAVACTEISAPYSVASGDVDPVWSPDGTRVAFTRTGKEDAGHIYVVDSDGSNLRRLSRDNDKNESPAWSPDGRRILFENLNGVTIVDVDGGDLQVVGDEATGDWSPDGRWIAFGRGGGIDLARVGTTKLRHLVTGGEYPTWSPDGKAIAFTKSKGNSSQVFVMLPNGTSVRRLTNASDFTSLAWSPDGESIAFTRRVADHYRIFVMSANGTRVRALAEASGWDAGYPSFAWSPDGRWIAFDRNHGISIVRVADGKTRRVVREALNWSWSPDGRAIGFVLAGDLYTVRIHPLAVQRFPTSHRVEEFTWSPNSRMIAVSADGRLFVVDTGDGRSRPLTDGGF